MYNVTTNSHLSPESVCCFVIAALFFPVCASVLTKKDKKNAKLASYKFILILLRGLFYYYLIFYKRTHKICMFTMVYRHVMFIYAHVLYRFYYYYYKN